MSKFSGKSDFADTVEMHYSPEEVLKANIYVTGVRVYPKDEKDLIPLYPRIIGMMGASKNDDGTSNMTIHVSSKSYNDEMDIERSSWVIRDILSVAKGKGVRPTYEEVYKANGEYSAMKDPAAQEILANLPEWAFKIKLTKNYEANSIICKGLAERYWEPSSAGNFHRETLVKYAEEKGCDMVGELGHQKWLVERYKSLQEKYGVKEDD